MTLDNIQLPAIVLQDLFKTSLIELEMKQRLDPAVSKSSFQVLGNNGKSILIIVESDDALYLEDEQLNFLLGILSACSLTMADVAILNLKKNQQVTYKNLSTELKPEKLFLFGIKPAQIGLPLDFPNYQLQQFNHQVYLTAPMLSVLQDDKAEKIKLWNCLKQIFAL